MSADYVRRIQRDVLPYRPSIIVPRSLAPNGVRPVGMTVAVTRFFADLLRRLHRAFNDGYMPRRYVEMMANEPPLGSATPQPPNYYLRIPLIQTFNAIARLRLWARRAVNTVTRRRNVQRALVHGINTGGHYDRQVLLRRLQFVN